MISSLILVLTLFLASSTYGQSTGTVWKQVPTGQPGLPMTVWDKLLEGIELTDSQRNLLAVIHKNFGTGLMAVSAAADAGSKKSEKNYAETTRQLVIKRIEDTRAVLNSKQRVIFDRNLAPLRESLYQRQTEIHIDSVQIVGSPQFSNRLDSAGHIGDTPSLPVRQLEGWERYTPGTLKSLIEEQGAILREMDTDRSKPDTSLLQFTISGEDFPRIATVTYSGESRPLSKEKSYLVHGWFKSILQDSTQAKVFEKEYHFRESEVDYWLPVQRQVADFFPKELQPGDTIYIYAMWIGAYRQGKEDLEWVFLVNEFVKEIESRTSR